MCSVSGKQPKFQGDLKMPDIEINFYLSNGGKATLKIENSTESVSTIDGIIRAKLAQSGDSFNMAKSNAVITLKKNEIVGYSVDAL
jgi:hypothetical protein